jgi:hypothetical protein
MKCHHTRKQQPRSFLPHASWSYWFGFCGLTNGRMSLGTKLVSHITILHICSLHNPTAKSAGVPLFLSIQNMARWYPTVLSANTIVSMYLLVCSRGQSRSVAHPSGQTEITPAPSEQAFLLGWFTISQVTGIIGIPNKSSRQTFNSINNQHVYEERTEGTKQASSMGIHGPLL